MKKKSWKDIIPEDQFWELIEESLSGSNYSLDAQIKSLKRILSLKSINEMVGFCYYSNELYRKSFQSNLWAAPFIARKGCGDDSFHYFRNWLITRGKVVYYEALLNPDSLISEFAFYENRDDILMDSLSVVANEVYQEKGLNNEELLDLIEEKYEKELDNKSEMELSQEMVFDWEEGDEESLRRICPNLFEKYWNDPLRFNN